MNPNRPGRLNRVVLSIIGLICFLGGGLVLLAGTGIFARLLPGFQISPDAPLLPGNLLLPDWWPWAGAAAAVVLGFLCLRWLAAQAIRQPARREWQLAPDSRLGKTRITSDTAADPVAVEIAAYPGVRTATARLAGPRQQPRLFLRVDADDRADVSDLRHRIDHDAIPHLVAALDIPALHADLLLRLDSAKGARAR